MREKLNNRRANETVTFQTQGHRYVATVSRFPDGRIAELFLNGEKASSELDAAARDAAIVFSMAMQYGADPSTIRHALGRDERGEAMGPLAGALDILMR